MVLLPVVERELRGAARGRAMYRVRFLAVLVMSAIFGWCMLTLPQNQNLAQASLEVLVVLTMWALVASLIIGAIATSDSVSREKREGTLGLLFLTDLKGYDVICGKLAANSIHAFYALVATLPIFSIPLLIGGVTFGQFCKLSLVLLTTMVLSLAVGIFVSTYSRQERKAMVYTILMLAGLTFVLPFLAAELVDNLAPGTNFVWLGLMFSPVYGAFATMAASSLGRAGFFPVESYWCSVAWQWLVAALLIARASTHIAHAWEESGAARKPERMGFKFRQGAASVRRLLAKDPILWLCLRTEAGRGRVWFFVLAMFGLWLVGVSLYGLGMMVDDDVMRFVLPAVHWPLRIWIASEASRRFVDERSHNTFEFLLTTPLTERDIIRGQWRALFHQFAWPMAAVVAWEGFMAFSPHRNPGWEGGFIAYLVLNMFLLVMDALALGWVGLWLGLVCRGRTRAIVGSLAVVIGIPWGLCGLFVVLDWLVRREFAMPPNSYVTPAIRLICGLLLNATLIFLIRARLPGALRRLASR